MFIVKKSLICKDYFSTFNEKPNSVWIDECDNKITHLCFNKTWKCVHGSCLVYGILEEWCKEIKRRKATLKHLKKEWL